MITDTDYQTLAAVYGYHPHPQYGEWVMEGDSGERPCRPQNWHPEDLAAFLGGEYAVREYRGCSQLPLLVAGRHRRHCLPRPD